MRHLIETLVTGAACTYKRHVAGDSTEPALCCLHVQLPSRLEVLTRLRAEKAEAAALRVDPLGTAVDAQQESLARLQALQQQQQQQPGKAVAAEDPQQASKAAAANNTAATVGDILAADDSAAPAVAAGAGDAEGGAADDPYAGMNPRQRKLYELKQKMQAARKSNEKAIIAERKRQRVRLGCCRVPQGSASSSICLVRTRLWCYLTQLMKPCQQLTPSDHSLVANESFLFVLWSSCASVFAAQVAGAEGDGAKRWYDERKKRQEEELARLGLTPEDTHRLETAEIAQAKYQKNVSVNTQLC